VYVRLPTYFQTFYGNIKKVAINLLDTDAMFTKADGDVSAMAPVSFEASERSS
jgi:hypothetical protein